MTGGSYAVEFAGGPGAFWTAAAVLLAAFWHARSSRKSGVLLALRLAAAVLLAVTVLRPTLAYRQAHSLKPRLHILIDEGQSMSGPALRDAKRWLAKNRSHIDSKAEVSFWALSDRARALPGWEGLNSLEGSPAEFDPSAALGEVLERVEAESHQPHLWLISDGNVEAEVGPEAVSKWKYPLDVLGAGSTQRSRGLACTELSAPSFVFLHSSFNLAVQFEAVGLKGKVRLKLFKGAPEAPAGKEWNLIAEKEQELPASFETAAASFTARAENLGLERYRLEISQGSVKTSREVRVEVIRQKYRIMYLAGRPSPEYFHLREFLKADPNHELVSFVILRNPDNPRVVPDNELSLIPFPAEEIFVSTLRQFDLFILENFSYRRFDLPESYLAGLKNFVATGGALMVIGGENAFGLGGYRGTSLEELLPVSLSAQSEDYIAGAYRAKPAAPDHPLVKLYDTREASAAAWAALPSLEGYARFGSVKPQSSVLVVHPEERAADGSPLPIVALRSHGRGKVMLVASDSTWRWKLGSARDWSISQFYSRFWTRAVQYLTGSLDLSKVKFSPLPDRLPPREPAKFSLHVFDEGFQPAPAAATEVSVIWNSPSGAKSVTAESKEPGVYEIDLVGLVPGSHRLTASARYKGKPWGEDRVGFLWQPQDRQAPMNQAWLKQLAAKTGGAYADLRQSDAEELLRRLPPPRGQAQVRKRYYPWADLPWLALLALLFLVEWGVRRWRGLL